MIEVLVLIVVYAVIMTAFAIALIVRLENNIRRNKKFFLEIQEIANKSHARK